MANKAFLARFKPSQLGSQTVIAERAEIQGDHLVFLDSRGALAALFLMEIVDSWSEIELRPSQP